MLMNKQLLTYYARRHGLSLDIRSNVGFTTRISWVYHPHLLETRRYRTSINFYRPDAGISLFGMNDPLFQTEACFAR